MTMKTNCSHPYQIKLKTKWRKSDSEEQKATLPGHRDENSDSEFGDTIYDSSDPPEDQDLHDDIVLYMSRLALAFYNIREGTYFGDVKILTVKIHGWDDYSYITFQAFSSESETSRAVPVTFQTKILFDHHNPIPKFEIIFVRIRPCPLKYKRRRPSDINQDQPPEFDQPDEFDHKFPMSTYQMRLSEVIKTYTIDDSQSDSRYGLALYLSQYALVSYHLHVLAKPVAKHDIESLKVLNLVKSVAEVPSYLITFKAPLRVDTEGKSAETFETEICIPTLFPTITIVLKSEARVIPGGCDLKAEIQNS